jgi:hypothetical protein
MTQKEIIHIYNTGSKNSELLEPMINNYIDSNPEISYLKLEAEEDRMLINQIIPSRPPITSPFFIGMVDGRINGTASGMISQDDLGSITN